MTSNEVPASMRAPRFDGEGMIQLVEKPVPTPGPGQLLVRVKANALCGSERGQFYGGSPVTPGHETAGVVAAGGPGTHTTPGTPGVIFLMDFCGECRDCRQGFTNQCLAKRADMGFNRDGGYGEYELVSEKIFFPVDPTLPLDEATLLLDILGTGGHVLQRGRLVRPDIESIAIAGTGPIGLGVLAVARVLLGPDLPVFVADTVPFRLELAMRLGGIPVPVGGDSLSAALARSGLEGADLAVDTSGRAAARQALMNALGKRGVLVCVGHGEDLRLEVSPDLIAPERAVLGSEYFPYHDLPENLELLRRNRDYFSQIITHRFPVGEIQAAFETFFAGNTGKVVIIQ